MGLHKSVTKAWHAGRLNLNIEPGIRVSHSLFGRYSFWPAAKMGEGILLLLVTMAPAFADQLDTLSYIVNAGINFDDNIFRLPDGVDPQIILGKESKSDMNRFLTLGINAEKEISNQELIFNGMGTNTKYRTFPNLDYTSSSLKGIWNWKIGTRLSGSMSASRAQTMNNPADTKIYARNLNTVDNTSFNGDWWGSGNWHLLFSVTNGRATNSIDTANNLSSQSRTNEWGVKYDPADGKSIAVISRNLRGTNANQIPDPITLTDTGYFEKQLELQANWQLTGKSALSGNLMNIDHRNKNFSERDYVGTQGRINYSVDISGKSSLNMSLQRSLSSWWDLASSYLVSDSASISARWQIVPKALVHMAMNQGSNNYYGPIVPGAIARRDITQSVQLGIDWALQRALTLSASLQHSKRISIPENYSGYGFTDNAASLSVQANF